MYELFLTALVEDADFKAACAVLSGLCAMSPWETFERVLYYQGPPRPSGISNQSSIEKPVRKDAAFLWKDLHQSLCRQSFVLQLRYELVQYRDKGTAAEPLDLEATPAILRWTDFPDPPHGRPLITQRKTVELWEQKKLPAVMKDNHYQFKTETVEEMYRFFREHVEFCLTRHYFLRPISDYVPLETKAGSNLPTPCQDIPAWESLTAVDRQKRWILQVKTRVLPDNKPDEIRAAQDLLLSIRGELEGVFDFKVIDRKVHDTRIALQQPEIQTLPQKVVLGKS